MLCRGVNSPFASCLNTGCAPLGVSPNGSQRGCRSWASQKVRLRGAAGPVGEGEVAINRPGRRAPLPRPGLGHFARIVLPGQHRPGRL
jgi:hypothetical protein